MENTVVLVTRDGMGNADEKLQHLLFSKYLELLSQHESLPPGCRLGSSEGWETSWKHS